VPVYEFRCSTCHAVFDERRPMAEADTPATCPGGHGGARRLLPLFATTRNASRRPGVTDVTPCDVSAAVGGCGSGCACC
jgi:putative FmdB family regulatory protein